MRMRKPSSYSSSSSSSKSSQSIISTTGADAGMSSSSSVQVNKNITPCCTKVGLKRGPWTPQEDQLLSDYIKIEGQGKWRTLPKKAGLLRCGKSCRLRWMNYLRPSVKRGHIAPDEEDLILRLHRLLGNRWSLIAGRIPGRTDNEIKNYWNTHLSKKLISQGIDPRTHKPLEPNYDHSSNENKFSSDHILADPNSSLVVPSPLIVEEDTAAVGGIKPRDDEFQSAEMRDEKEKENDENNMQTNGDGDQVYGMSIDQEGFSNELYDDEDMNYCSDDIFSSFLNSLINEEDVFNSQNTVEEQQPNNDDDGLISTTQMIFSFGPGWEAPVMGCASNSQLHENENDSKRVNGEDEN